MQLKASALPPTLAEGSNSSETSCDLSGNQRVSDPALLAAVGGAGVRFTHNAIAVDAATYSAGDVVGGLITFTPSVAATADQEFDLRSANMKLAFPGTVTVVPVGMSSLTLRLFSAQPSAIADNAAYAPTAADYAKAIAMLSFGTPSLNGTVGASSPLDGISKQITRLLASNGILYGYLTADTAITGAPAAPIPLTIGLHGVPV